MSEPLTRDELLSALRAHIQHDHITHAQETLDRFNSLNRSVYWGPIWARVKSILERWPDEEQEVPVALCEQQLLQWPHTARTEHSWLTPHNLTTRAPKLRLIGRLTIDQRPTPEQLDALNHPEALPHVRELYISGALPPAQLHELLHTPIMAQISALQIGYGQLSLKHIQALIEAPAREHLQSLTLHRAELGLEGVTLLASAPWPQLEHLDLNKGHITDEGLEALFAQPHLPKLRELRLSQNDLTAKAAQTLTTLELTLLDLEFNDGRSALAKALAQSPSMAALEHLNLGANEIGDVGLQALAKSPHLSALRSLNLRGNHHAPLVTDKGVEALAHSKTIRSLESICLDLNNLTHQSLATLLSSPQMRHLKRLSLTHQSKIDLAQATALTTLEPLAPLRALDLTYCGLSDKQAAAALLPKLQLPKTLDTLMLFGVELNLELLKAISQHPHLLEHLRHLNINGFSAKAEHAQLLSELRLPSIERLELGAYNQQADVEDVERLAQAPWFSELLYLSVKVTEAGSAALKPHITRHMIACWD